MDPADPLNNPLFHSTSMLADLFFAMSRNFSKCFQNRNDMAAAAALLTITYYKGTQTDAVMAASIKDVSVVGKSEPDERFLFSYAALFSKIILPRVITGKVPPDQFLELFILRSEKVIAGAIFNSQKNSAIGRYPDGILEYAKNFVASRNFDSAEIHRYIAGYIDERLYAAVSSHSSPSSAPSPKPDTLIPPLPTKSDQAPARSVLAEHHAETLSTGSYYDTHVAPPSLQTQDRPYARTVSRPASNHSSEPNVLAWIFIFLLGVGTLVYSAAEAGRPQRSVNSASPSPPPPSSSGLPKTPRPPSTPPPTRSSGLPKPQTSPSTLPPIHEIKIGDKVFSIPSPPDSRLVPGQFSTPDTRVPLKFAWNGNKAGLVITYEFAEIIGVSEIAGDESLLRDVLAAIKKKAAEFKKMNSAAKEKVHERSTSGPGTLTMYTADMTLLEEKKDSIVFSTPARFDTKGLSADAVITSSIFSLAGHVVAVNVIVVSNFKPQADVALEGVTEWRKVIMTANIGKYDLGSISDKTPIQTRKNVIPLQQPAASGHDELLKDLVKFD